MNVDYGHWGSQILFAALCIAIGVVGIVLARTDAELSLQKGLFLQGILLASVVSAAFFQDQIDLKLGGIVIVGLLIIQSTLGSPQVITDEQELDEKESKS